MIGLRLSGGQPIRTVLLLGAHCDDIEIGCGGTLLRLARELPGTRFVWVTLSSDDQRAAETRSAAALLLAGASVEVHCERFRGSYFPYEGTRIKDYFEALKKHVTPDLVLTHYRHDLHQDHRVTCELTWNTFRDHLVLEYEIPKFDGDLGAPNLFVPLTRADLDAKNDVLIGCFPSQRERSWFSRETFSALARLRGVECNAPEGYAEAYHARKLQMGFSDR